MSRAIAKFIVLGAVTGLLTGCAAPRPPLPPALQLPRPVKDLRAVRKADKVYLTWTIPTRILDGQSVRHPGITRICRRVGAEVKECGTPAGVTLPPMLTGNSPALEGKLTANYVDTLGPPLLDPSKEIFYAVEVLNESQRSAGLSNVVQVPAAGTLAAPADFAAQLTADGVVLQWARVAPLSAAEPAGSLLRIYRRQEGAKTEAVAAELPLDVTRFVDHGFEWQKTSYYRATVVTLVPREGKTEAQVEGDDTPIVKVFADDVFPPAVPSGLQAVFSGVGQQPFVDLIWAPDVETDLAGYNLFRHEEGAGPVKINTELVKTPAYRDNAVHSGAKYFYSVSAVDLRGNESGRSEEASEQVP
jgi:hypothetical protein